MTRRILCAAITATALIAPAAAHAAANHTGTLNQFGDKFAWSDANDRFALGAEYAGPPVAMCADPGYPCDTTLINVTAPGQLDIEVHDTGLVRPDVDIYLYASDKDGTVGDAVASSETTSADEAISTLVEPGYYLLRVAYFSGLQNNSTGKAALSEPPPPDPEEEEGF